MFTSAAVNLEAGEVVERGSRRICVPQGYGHDFQVAHGSPDSALNAVVTLRGAFNNPPSRCRVNQFNLFGQRLGCRHTIGAVHIMMESPTGESHPAQPRGTGENPAQPLIACHQFGRSQSAG